MADEKGKPPRKRRSKSTYGAEPPEPPETGYGDGYGRPEDDEGEAVEAHAEVLI